MQNTKSQAKSLQKQGRYGDTMLAHLNPAQAVQLQRQSGNYGRNPKTGLQEHFNFAPMLAKAAASYFMSKAMTGNKNAGYGSMIGNILGGPLGGAIGGGIGGRMGPRDKRVSFGRGATGGFLGGIGGNVGANWTNKAFSGEGNDFVSSLFSGDTGGLSKLLGGGKGNSSNKNSSTKETAESTSGLGDFGNLFSPTNLLLAGTALYGMKKRKPTVEQIESPEAGGDRFRRTKKAAWGPEDQPRKVKPMNRKYIQPPAGYIPGIDPEHQYYEDVNPETEYYASGGYVDGNSGGQEDNRPVHLPNGAFVMNATDVSLLGDGNSENGKLKLQQMEKQINGGSFKSSLFKSGKKPNALVSDSEFVVDPITVEKKGGGSLTSGSKEFNKFRKNLRKQKGVEKVLPPKTKETFSYFKG